MEPFPVVPLTYDEEGYVTSFKMDEEEKYMEFFNTYGFVVIDEVLDEFEVGATINEIWMELEAKPWNFDNVLVSRNNSETWTNFPRSQVGIIRDDPCIGPQAWRNRQNPNLVKVFTKIMGKEQLWVSIDRFGLMRPTKNVPVGNLDPVEIRNNVKDNDKNLPLQDFDEWKTVPLWLHWDLNPYLWTTGEGFDYEFLNFVIENNDTKFDGDLKLQGLINLVDSTEDDGGFCTVPGFHKYLKEWAEKTKDSEFAQKRKHAFFVSIPQNDKMRDQHVKITSRAGSLIVWRSEQPHCNFPNNSNVFRINQYIKMIPAREKCKGVQERRTVMRQLVSKFMDEVTPLGRKVFGLDSWYGDKDYEVPFVEEK